jgi:TM2 domain-containing membrane protein YozV
MGVILMENTTNEPNTPTVVNKEPLLAAIGSFFFPGLGQVYNGEGMVKGLMYLIGWLIGSLIFIIPGLAIWLYGIYNAYKVADKMKSGTIPAKGTTTVNLIIFIVLSVVIDVVYAFILFMIFAAIAVLIYGISSSSVSSY